MTDTLKSSTFIAILSCPEQQQARTQSTSVAEIRSGTAANPAPDAILRMAITEALEAGRFFNFAELPALRAEFEARFRQAA